MNQNLYNYYLRFAEAQKKFPNVKRYQASNKKLEGKGIVLYVYAYDFVNPQGEQKIGIIEAMSKDQAKTHLQVGRGSKFLENCKVNWRSFRTLHSYLYSGSTY